MTELNFKGKEFVYNHHLAVPFRPLVPHQEKGIGPVALDGNLIIHGDNLHALKALLPMFAGKVDCIFIDPPYNTGNEGWSYNDNVNSPMIKEWLAANPIGIEDGLRHDKWCAMMWPRLRLLHELLSNDGFIFVCIDNNESHRLRGMLDELFGEDNFRNEIIIRRGVKNVQSQFEDIDSLSVGHDTMYLYSKRSDVRLPKLMTISDEDEPGKWDTFWRGTDRETMRYTLFGEKPETGQWRWKETRANQAKKNYEEFLADFSDKMSLDDYFYLRTQELGTDCDFVRKNDDGVVQYYVSPRNYKLMSDVWMRLPTAGRFTEFQHEKHLELVQTAISWVTKPNSIVLDSFAGSGSTGHAVLGVNARDNGERRFILVEMEEYADTLTANRIRKAIKSANDTEGGLLIGLAPTFSFCTLGAPVELDRVLSGEALPSFTAIGSALFHMATNRAFDPSVMLEADGYLGETESQHVWLIYKPDLDWLKSPDAALTLSRAKAFAAKDPEARHLVFAPARYVSQKMLDEQNIPVEFVPLPFALYRHRAGLTVVLRQLDYQDRVLQTLDAYLGVLKEERAKAEKVAELIAAQPDLGIPHRDFAAETWNRMKAAGKLPASRAAIFYSPRHDGIGRPVPDVVLKVPTGGGKTLLAVHGLSRVFGRDLNRNTGFVLWIVPNEAIYSQTLRHLKDRQHPYRQALDRAAAGRVRIMEKTDRLDRRDVDSQLCVMLLMLQSANRETQDSLKMFQDRGDVHGFTPPEGDQLAHKKLLQEVPNLAGYEGLFPMVKDSLGNALRMIRPIVVLDEGHKAVSDLAFKTLYDFNPRFVLELTATPHDVQPLGGRSPKPGRTANVLVEVTGKELDREGMIKMPLNLDARQGTDWKATLNAGLAKLSELDRAAQVYRAETSRYIRPIILIQVERTGKDQRDSGHIHSEDVRDWLMTTGFDLAEIAVKTAETNDLSQPENQNLLSPTNRVRAIITKSALQEGWDCPFAYVLCSLAASANLKAMTQLIGRILRQPGALKTGVAALDECHVITHHAGTADVVQAVKNGLEQDGLGDLVVLVAQSGAAGDLPVTRTINRRNSFASTEIYLPRVMMIDGAEVRELDYETDVQAAIDWRDFDPAAIAARIPENAEAVESQLQRISLTDDEELFKGESIANGLEILDFDPAYAVRMISDLVPNPFVGRAIVGDLLAGLGTRGFMLEKIGRLAGLVLDELRKGLDVERTARAEALFKAKVRAGAIQFRLRLDGKNWQMPFTIETTFPGKARQLVSKTGGPLDKSLFAPVYEDDLNGEEKDVAVHLDGDSALTWWHRNVARRQYGIQGWKRAKIYPDFIFAIKRENGSARITVLETKGDQLDNLDTAYKRDVLKVMTECFAWDTTVPAGTLELIQSGGETVECELILMSDVPTRLPDFLTRSIA